MREPGQVKRAPRVDTKFKAKLTDSDGNVVPVTVMDISREGCRLEAEGMLKITAGDKVEYPAS